MRNNIWFVLSCVFACVSGATPPSVFWEVRCDEATRLAETFEPLARTSKKTEPPILVRRSQHGSRTVEEVRVVACTAPSRFLTRAEAEELPQGTLGLILEVEAAREQATVRLIRTPISREKGKGYVVEDYSATRAVQLNDERWRRVAR